MWKTTQWLIILCLINIVFHHKLKGQVQTIDLGKSMPLKLDSIIRQDINHDGYQDYSLKYWYNDWRTEANGHYIIKNGKNKKVFKLNYNHNFFNLRTLVEIPNELLKDSLLFRHGFLGHFRTDLQKKPENSLKCLLEAYHTLHTNPQWKYLKKRWRFTPTWQRGNITIPEEYSFLADSITSQYLLKTDQSTALIFYHSDLHFQFREERELFIKKIDSLYDPETQDFWYVYRTYRGILISHQQQYMWVLMADGHLFPLTKGVDNSDRGGLYKTQFVKNYLFVENYANNYAVVIDYKKGICANLKGGVSFIDAEKGILKMKVKNSRFDQSVSLHEVLSELDEMYSPPTNPNNKNDFIFEPILNYTIIISIILLLVIYFLIISKKKLFGNKK